LLTFTWNSFPHQTYRLEYKTKLALGDWLPFGPSLTATNTAMSTSHSLPAEGTRFYRIAEVEPD